MKPKIIILSGAGMSQESGISTFRDANGLWQNHKIEEVASPNAWNQNPALVLEFYNQRRRQLLSVKPNAAHYAITKLQQYLPVKIITQNVDDLHERAGNKNVLHLHGELLKVRSTKNPNLVYKWTKDLYLGDKAEDEAQLRPHIVWFGEAVPEINNAIEISRQADIFIIVGTSMQVYPAAGLVSILPLTAKIYYIDPHPAKFSVPNEIHIIKNSAGRALPELVNQLIEKYVT